MSYRKNDIIIFFYVILCYENSLCQIIYIIFVHYKFHVFKIHYDIFSSTDIRFSTKIWCVILSNHIAVTNKLWNVILKNWPFFKHIMLYFVNVFKIDFEIFIALQLFNNFWKPLFRTHQGPWWLIQISNFEDFCCDFVNILLLFKKRTSAEEKWYLWIVKNQF